MQRISFKVTVFGREYNVKVNAETKEEAITKLWQEIYKNIKVEEVETDTTLDSLFNIFN